MTLWPGGRNGTSYPASQALSGGGRRFIAGYVLRNVCHACETVGTARYAFDFDRAGTFLGAKLLRVAAASPGTRARH